MNKVIKTSGIALAVAAVVAIVAYAIGGDAFGDPKDSLNNQPIDELGKSALNCFRMTAEHQSSTEIQAGDTISLNDDYGADKVRFIRINWKGGFLGTPYQTDVAFLTKGSGSNQQYRVKLLRDTGAFPVTVHCPFSTNWISLKQIRELKNR